MNRSARNAANAPTRRAVNPRSTPAPTRRAEHPDETRVRLFDLLDKLEECADCILSRKKHCDDCATSRYIRDLPA
jgi:hypothetical protein